MERHSNRLVTGFIILVFTMTTVAIVVLLHAAFARYLGPPGYLVPSAVMLTSYGLGALVARMTGDVP